MSLPQWIQDNGNNTHAITYPLNENSTVVDLGGFHGVWADQIISKYNPNIFLFEPIPAFYEILKTKFSNNPKVKVFNFGISTSNHEGVLYLNEDGTSKYVVNNTPVKVNFITVTKLLELIGCETVDLIQINIEGEEYELLKQMLENKTSNNFKNIQIQFHTYVENAVEKRSKIQVGLSENFNKLYDYPFVFEGWTLKNK
jgi:FkbM family methyltransferase